MSELEAASYLDKNTPTHHMGRDSLFIVTKPLALAQLFVQLLVDILQHKADGALGNVQKVLAADKEEAQQHQADEQLCEEAPHDPLDEEQPGSSCPPPQSKH